MKFKILIILFSIFYFFFSFGLISAIGVGASPSVLDLELKVGQSKKTKILVYNISQEAGIFQVFPEELSEWMEVKPDNFRLEAGENKEVKITILAEEDGRKTTNLSVLAKPVDRRSFSAFSGIKIPLRLNITEERSLFLASVLGAISQDWILIFITLVIILVGFFLVKYFKLWRLFYNR